MLRLYIKYEFPEKDLLSAFGGDKTILPIPQRDVDNNPALEPNKY